VLGNDCYVLVGCVLMRASGSDEREGQRKEGDFEWKGRNVEREKLVGEKFPYEAQVVELLKGW
jgi:hypothetical protein